jgi:integrase
VANAPAEYKVLFTIAIATGVRQGELVGFIWSDLDVEARTLSVTGSVYRGRRKAPKTKASARPLGLPPGLIAALKYHREQSEFNRAGDYIFARADGRPQDPDHLRRQVLYPILDAMKIERSDRTHGFHAFRHSAGSGCTKPPAIQS